MGRRSLAAPDYTRALIGMSRGGADARVYREFDLANRRVRRRTAFTLEEAKGGVGWIDLDTVFVQTDFGAGSMTDSGYPRIAKIWKRGQALTDAETVYEGQQTDMSVAAIHDDSPGFERNFVSRNIAFYNDELFLAEGQAAHQDRRSQLGQQGRLPRSTWRSSCASLGGGRQERIRPAHC